MTTINAHRISRHAKNRFRERIRDVPEDKIEAEMLSCLNAAKQSKLRQLEVGTKNTSIIPTGCCAFIGSKGNIVTVVRTLRTDVVSRRAGVTDEFEAAASDPLVSAILQIVPGAKVIAVRSEAVTETNLHGVEGNKRNGARKWFNWSRY